MSDWDYGTTAKAVTARKRHRCDAGYREVHVIAPGHRYLRHTVFPGHDANTSHRPYNVTECVLCVEDRETAGGLLVAGACAMLCCGDVPCALPFKHDGDRHSCHRCARESSVTAFPPSTPVAEATEGTGEAQEGAE